MLGLWGIPRDQSILPKRMSFASFDLSSWVALCFCPSQDYTVDHEGISHQRELPAIVRKA
jgi:hypothetical protein